MWVFEVGFEFSEMGLQELQHEATFHQENRIFFQLVFGSSKMGLLILMATLLKEYEEFGYKRTKMDLVFHFFCLGKIYSCMNFHI